MIISPFTPLFFPTGKSDGLESPYLQVFSPKDRIMAQVITTAGVDGDVSFTLKNTINGISIGLIPQKWDANGVDIVTFVELSGLDKGVYSLVISCNGKNRESEPFRITDDLGTLEDTTLIQYSMNSNRHRKDTAFFIDGMQYFFDFRAPGGFKDANWSFSVDGEQFETDRGDIVQLYGLEGVQQKFTMGTSEGCPIWYGELLNRVLCCSYVYFDGVRYTRKEENTPEVSQPLDGLDSFIFTQTLQKVAWIDPELYNRHQIIMRRAIDDFRAIDNDINRTIR